MTDYDMQRHWSEVGKELEQRPGADAAADSDAPYALAGDDGPYLRYKAARFAADLLPRVRVEGRSVLDVGCGAGGPLRAMQLRHPKRLAGCDQAAEMVRLASQNAPEAEVTQIDGDTLPYENNEFDVVTTVTVLQHNPDSRRSQIISEICRVAREEVVFFEDTVRTMPVSPEGQGQYKNFFGRPVSWYESECRSHGFSLVETEGERTFVSFMAYIYLRRFDRQKRTEGMPVSNLHWKIERMTLPITKQLDKLMKRRGSLTMMRFTRSSS